MIAAGCGPVFMAGVRPVLVAGVFIEKGKSCLGLFGPEGLASASAICVQRQICKLWKLCLYSILLGSIGEVAMPLAGKSYED